MNLIIILLVILLAAVIAFYILRELALPANVSADCPANHWHHLPDRSDRDDPAFDRRPHPRNYPKLGGSNEQRAQPARAGRTSAETLAGPIWVAKAKGPSGGGTGQGKFGATGSPKRCEAASRTDQAESTSGSSSAASDANLSRGPNTGLHQECPEQEFLGRSRSAIGTDLVWRQTARGTSWSTAAVSNGRPCDPAAHRSDGRWEPNGEPTWTASGGSDSASPKSYDGRTSFVRHYPSVPVGSSASQRPDAGWPGQPLHASKWADA